MNDDKFFKGVLGVWLVGFIAWLGFWAFIIWAIYQLVTHVVGG